MAVSSIRRQFAHFFLRWVNEWQSLSAEDSSFRLRISRQGRQMAVSFSRRQFVPFEITDGSLLHEDSSFKNSKFSSQQMAVSSIRRQFAHFFLRWVNEWQSLSAEDSSFRLRISRQGRQMAVSFSRRQFVPFEITDGSLLHEDSSFKNSNFKVSKWQSPPLEDNLLIFS